MPRTEPVTVLMPTPGDVDVLGHETPGALVEVETVQALVAPGAQTDTTGRDGWIVEYTLYALSLLDVNPTAVVRVRGADLRIVGKPQTWQPAYGPHRGTVIEVGTVVG